MVSKANNALCVFDLCVYVIILLLFYFLVSQLPNKHDVLISTGYHNFKKLCVSETKKQTMPVAHISSTFTRHFELLRQRTALCHDKEMWLLELQKDTSYKNSLLCPVISLSLKLLYHFFLSRPLILRHASY